MEVVDPKESLRVLLQSPKSLLTTTNISDIINLSTWSLLSPESQTALRALLPPTAFTAYQESLGPDHPAFNANASSAMDVDSPSTPLGELNPSIFNDPHFLAAAHTFQDHLYSNWLSDTHSEKVRVFLEGIRDGSLAAPWKDEVWEKDHPETPVTALANEPESGARAGGAAEIKLITLAKNGVIRVGDVIAYSRHFSTHQLLIEKDVVVQSIHPSSHALTVLASPSTTKSLPPPLLSTHPSDPEPPTRSMTITSPTMLETGLLDMDGRIEKVQRPNGNAWKRVSVWRWRDGVGGVGGEGGERGGRENHGTLFYLRGCYYNDMI